MKDYFFEAMKLLRSRNVFGAVSVSEIEKVAQKIYVVGSTKIPNEELLKVMGRAN